MIGKSSLVSELYKSIAQKDFFFIRGKYDSYLSESCYAFQQAIKNFCDELILKNDDVIEIYKSKIKRAIGDDGKILTDLIPSLKSLIGQQPNISYSFGKEAKNQFANVFIRFIHAICELHPIILLLDDLQWLDPESAYMLSALIADDRTRNLMLVGTYRENELNIWNEIERLVRDARRKNIIVTRIGLKNMDYEATNDMIADSLRLPSLETYALMVQIHKRTSGNPFFAKQMMKTLFEQGHIFFCDINHTFKWDASIIGSDYENICENISDLLRDKILSLSEYAQQALKVASW